MDYVHPAIILQPSNYQALPTLSHKQKLDSDPTALKFLIVHQLPFAYL